MSNIAIRTDFIDEYKKVKSTLQRALYSPPYPCPARKKMGNVKKGCSRDIFAEVTVARVSF